MKFEDANSTQEVVPFLKDYVGDYDVDKPIFVERLVALEKGVMCISSEYKATAWIGSEACLSLRRLLESLSVNSENEVSAVFMRRNPSNEKQIQVAIEATETDKAKWKKISDRVYEATEILTKKKAQARSLNKA